MIILYICFMNLIERYPTLFWFIWCAILGTTGWCLHDFELYQPIWVWVLGTIVFETFSMFFIFILSSLLTSMIFWRHNDVIKQLAGMSVGVEYLNSRTSKRFCAVLIVLFHVAINIVMAYGLISRQT